MAERVQVNQLVRDGRLIATTADSGYAPFLQNWCLSLEALGIHEYVVFALDLQTFHLLAAMDLKEHAIYDGPKESAAPGMLKGGVQAHKRAAAVSWYDERYKQLMGSQPSRVLRLLSAGTFDLLFTDADVLWRKSPWPELERASRRHCQVQAIAGHQRSPALNQTVGTAGSATSVATTTDYDAAVEVEEPHPAANCDNCLNAGFIFFRRGAAVTEFVKRWTLMLSRQGMKDHNQKWLNWVLATGGSRVVGRRLPGSPRWEGAPTVCQLDPSRFPNGVQLRQAPLSACACSRASQHRDVHRDADQTQVRCRAQRSSELHNLSAAHTNFALSTTDKACLAKRIGLWLPSPDPMHSELLEALSPILREKAMQRLVPEYARVAANEGVVTPPVQYRSHGL